MPTVIKNLVILGACNLLGWNSPYSAEEYGMDRSKQRKHWLERDNHHYRLCSILERELDRQLSVHHLRPRSWWDGMLREANSLDNLISSYNTCHGKVENRFTECSPEEFEMQAKRELEIKPW